MGLRRNARTCGRICTRALISLWLSICAGTALSGRLCALSYLSGVRFSGRRFGCVFSWSSGLISLWLSGRAGTALSGRLCALTKSQLRSQLELWPQQPLAQQWYCSQRQALCPELPQWCQIQRPKSQLRSQLELWPQQPLAQRPCWHCSQRQALCPDEVSAALSAGAVASAAFGSAVVLLSAAGSVP